MKQVKKNLCMVSWRDTMIASSIILIAVGIIFLINSLNSGSDSYVSLIMLLAVFLISLKTSGFIYGILASVFGVFIVNFVFSYPYLQLDFTLEGYPLTFTIMIVVSLLTSTMTSNLKQQEELKLEIETEKMKTNLLRAISHDLRTPLTSIIGNINTTLDNYKVLGQDKRVALLQDAREDAEWLMRLVENTLLVTKFNFAEGKLQVQEEIVEEIVSEAVSKFHKHFPEQKVEVKVPDEILLVPMDGLLIEEVLNNLLENVVKHSKKSQTIKLYVTKEDDKAVFHVRDYGHGFSKEALKKQYNGFFLPGDTVNSDGSKNMGLGLMMCNSIIASHNGEMRISNAEGGGAIVTFTLPYRKEQEI